MSLKVLVDEKRAGEFVVSPVGPIDSASCPEFERNVDRVLFSGAKTIILNMEGATYITSMGLGVVIKTEKIMKEKGGTFIVANLPPQIKKVFDKVK